MPLRYFDCGTPAFHRIVGEIRRPSMRDLTASRRRLLEADARYQLNSGGRFDERQDYLRINSTLLTPIEVAERVIGHFDLPRCTGENPA